VSTCGSARGRGGHHHRTARTAFASVTGRHRRRRRLSRSERRRTPPSPGGGPDDGRRRRRARRLHAVHQRSRHLRGRRHRRRRSIRSSVPGSVPSTGRTRSSSPRWRSQACSAVRRIRRAALLLHRPVRPRHGVRRLGARLRASGVPRRRGRREFVAFWLDDQTACLRA
jgi:hypothetical protein